MNISILYATIVTLIGFLGGYMDDGFSKKSVIFNLIGFLLALIPFFIDALYFFTRVGRMGMMKESFYKTFFNTNFEWLKGEAMISGKTWFCNQTTCKLGFVVDCVFNTVKADGNLFMTDPPMNLNYICNQDLLLENSHGDSYQFKEGDFYKLDYDNGSVKFLNSTQMLSGSIGWDCICSLVNISKVHSHNERIIFTINDLEIELFYGVNYTVRHIPTGNVKSFNMDLDMQQFIKFHNSLHWWRENPNSGFVSSVRKFRGQTVVGLMSIGEIYDRIRKGEVPSNYGKIDGMCVIEGEPDLLDYFGKTAGGAISKLLNRLFPEHFEELSLQICDNNIQNNLIGNYNKKRLVNTICQILSRCSLQKIKGWNESVRMFDIPRDEIVCRYSPELCIHALRPTVSKRKKEINDRLNSETTSNDRHGKEVSKIKNEIKELEAQIKKDLSSKIDKNTKRYERFLRKTATLSKLKNTYVAMDCRDIPDRVIPNSYCHKKAKEVLKERMENNAKSYRDALMSNAVKTANVNLIKKKMEEAKSDLIKRFQKSFLPQIFLKPLNVEIQQKISKISHLEYIHVDKFKKLVKEAKEDHNRGLELKNRYSALLEDYQEQVHMEEAKKTSSDYIKNKIMYDYVEKQEMAESAKKLIGEVATYKPKRAMTKKEKKRQKAQRIEKIKNMTPEEKLLIKKKTELNKKDFVKIQHFKSLVNKLSTRLSTASSRPKFRCTICKELDDLSRNFLASTYTQKIEPTYQERDLSLKYKLKKFRRIIRGGDPYIDNVNGSFTSQFLNSNKSQKRKNDHSICDDSLHGRYKRICINRFSI